MLDTEVSKTGEVTVEGHVIGRLQGFEFALDATGEGQDAKALRAAAQKVLASEIEARAAKLSGAGDDQFLLSNDGVIRWVGEPVARLLPGETVLEPRFRVLADEQLNGPAKESVDARLALWLKAHIEKLLGPLNALAKAEDISGIARGIAFQLVESLGVLERPKVAEEVKGLDQETRATLRKYGVRFGAYHLYFPALLKPAPRTLALLLSALKHGGLDQSGYGDLPGLAASGRTSIPVDPEVSKELYRMVGYRVCGSRAIRVDILERLADLIRPALSWRPAMPGEKPPGAFDGRGFTVTVGMTSLAGCSGEDFASILRSLGYRLDRRPPLPPAPAEPSTAEPVAAETDAAPDAVPAADAPDEAAPDTADAITLAPTDATAPAPADASAEPPIELGLGGVDAQSDAPVTSDVASPELAAESPSASETTETAASAAPPPEFVDVWRPGRPEGARRPPRKPKQPRREVRIPDAPATAQPAEGSGQPQEASKPERKPRDQRRPRARNQGKDGRRPDHIRPQQTRTERPRDKPIDPNSPFAALLDLKARLEAEQKDKG